ncbi:MAG: dihydrofolate reductase [Candidatus Moranbacteria bacterium]|nr:dihydrofolate reductase [Candidatus Moranbacteria bacterium]MDD3965378.1 dihydrofolate reductase [Candidatus Moranbacteria bacterium]
MTKPRLSIIVAVDEKRAIGKDNQLLWHIPEDLKHFKELTTSHTVVMGENTYHSIGRPLPNRTNIILSLTPEFAPEGCFVVRSIDEALSVAKEHESEEIFIIGGASIYKQFLPIVDRLYVTEVVGVHDADTFFPDYSDFTKVVSEEKQNNGQYTFSFVVRERN